MSGDAGGMTAPLVPLTIGVIGHRDLCSDEVAAITSSIRDVLVSYRDRFPLTPILLLSSLAQGADQLAVEACQGLESVRLIGILPLAVDDYERDFPESGDLDEFRRCLASCESVVLADDLTASMSRAMSDPAPTAESARDMAYQRCARFISDQSHVLIAVWDGEPPEFPGGTSDTIHYRLASTERLTDDGRASLWPAEPGVLIHIPAARPARGSGTPGLGLAMAGTSRPRLIDEDFQQKQWNETIQDPHADRIEFLNLRSLAGGLPRGPLSVTQSIMNLADAEASIHQVQYRRRAASVVLAGICTLVLIHFEQSFAQRWLIGPALIAVTATGVLWFCLTRTNAKDKFQQSRALAEGARVQSAWLAAGVRSCPSDYYLQGQPDTSWIRRTMRSAWLADRIGSEAIQSPWRAANEWIQGQLDYFEGSSDRAGAIARNRIKARKYRLLTRAGVVLALLGMAIDAVRFITGDGSATATSDLGQVAWEVGLATAAASAAYGHLLAFDEIDRQYTFAAATYRRGLSDLVRLHDHDRNSNRIQKIVELVGLAALHETASWLALNRDRSVRPL